MRKGTGAMLNENEWTGASQGVAFGKHAAHTITVQDDVTCIGDYTDSRGSHSIAWGRGAVAPRTNSIAVAVHGHTVVIGHDGGIVYQTLRAALRRYVHGKGRRLMRQQWRAATRQ